LWAAAEEVAVVNQDTAGSRSAFLGAAHAAITDPARRRRVLLDRCNASPAERADLLAELKLAPSRVGTCRCLPVFVGRRARPLLYAALRHLGCGEEGA
jgi:hypothetical protein